MSRFSCCEFQGLALRVATQVLTPAHGLAMAARIAVGLYVVHNVFYAAFAYLGGSLSDHVPNRRAVLGAGYALAVVVALLLISQPASVPLLALIFALAGVVVGVEEAQEDSLAARN